MKVRSIDRPFSLWSVKSSVSFCFLFSVYVSFTSSSSSENSSWLEFAEKLFFLAFSSFLILTQIFSLINEIQFPLLTTTTTTTTTQKSTRNARAHKIRIAYTHQHSFKLFGRRRRRRWGHLFHSRSIGFEQKIVFLVIERREKMREMKNKTARRRRGNSLLSLSFSRLFSLALWCFLCHLCFSRLCFRGMGCCPPSSFSLRSFFRQFFGCYMSLLLNTEGRYFYWVTGEKNETKNWLYRSLSHPTL